MEARVEDNWPHLHIRFLGSRPSDDNQALEGHPGGVNGEHTKRGWCDKAWGRTLQCWRRGGSSWTPCLGHHGGEGPLGLPRHSCTWGWLPSCAGWADWVHQERVQHQPRHNSDWAPVAARFFFSDFFSSWEFFGLWHYLFSSLWKINNGNTFCSTLWLTIQMILSDADAGRILDAGVIIGTVDVGTSTLDIGYTTLSS